MRGRWFVIALFPALVVVNADAADDVSMMSLKQRLERLEQLSSSEILIEQSRLIDALREEISSLRQDIELSSYELETIKQRQRSLFLDMDRRLQSLEAGSDGLADGADFMAPVPPPTTGGTNIESNVAATAVENEPNTDIHGKAHYSKAFGFLKEGRYSTSINEFELFIKTYPESRYSDNAQYWLGEANYVSRNYSKALSEFQRLIAQFPDSSKIPGARLKIGYTYFELKNWSAAKESLQQVIKLYPNTAVSKKAEDRIQRIKREGH